MVKKNKLRNKKGIRKEFINMKSYSMINLVNSRKNRKMVGECKDSSVKLRIIYALILSIIFIVSSSSSVNASHLVCGNVYPAEDGITAATKTVYVYYPPNSANYHYCQVISGENKYCCDVTLIPGSTWSAGKVVTSSLIDADEGYFTYDVNTTTTSAGYDVAPDMTLYFSLNVSSPIEGEEYVVNHTMLIVDTYNGYSDEIKYNLDLDEEVLGCDGCNFASINMTELSEGEHTLVVYATKETSTISKTVNFSINAVNDPMTMNSYSPENLSVEVQENSSQVFSINVTDVDTDIDELIFTWKIDGVIVLNGSNENIFVFDEITIIDENYTLGVSVSDGGNTIYLGWNITIIEADNVIENGSNVVENNDDNTSLSEEEREGRIMDSIAEPGPGGSADDESLNGSFDESDAETIRKFDSSKRVTDNILINDSIIDNKVIEEEPNMFYGLNWEKIISALKVSLVILLLLLIVLLVSLSLLKKFSVSYPETRSLSQHSSSYKNLIKDDDEINKIIGDIKLEKDEKCAKNSKDAEKVKEVKDHEIVEENGENAEAEELNLIKDKIEEITKNITSLRREKYAVKEELRIMLSKEKEFFAFIETTKKDIQHLDKKLEKLKIEK